MKTWIGIDLGGTNLTGGIVSDTYTIKRKYSVPTNQRWTKTELLDAMETLCRELMKGAPAGAQKPEAIGIGVPGTANQQTGRLEYANNLAAEDFDIPGEMEQRLGITAAFENDANAAAWAEFQIGCGRGTNNFILLTLGTGVGGGVIVNGQLMRGVNYAAGELGHMVLYPEGRPCTCGRIGCFEMYGSATGLLQDVRDLRGRFPASPLFDNQEELDGRRILGEAKRGDGCAGLALKRYVSDLAQGITNLINIFQPEVLALGGGIGNGCDLFLPSLQTLTEQAVYSRRSGRQTRIVKAALGGDAGIIGAAMIAEMKKED